MNGRTWTESVPETEPFTWDGSLGCYVGERLRIAAFSDEGFACAGCKSECKWRGVLPGDGGFTAGGCIVRPAFAGKAPVGNEALGIEKGYLVLRDYEDDALFLQECPVLALDGGWKPPFDPSADVLAPTAPVPTVAVVHADPEHMKEIMVVDPSQRWAITGTTLTGANEFAAVAKYMGLKLILDKYGPNFKDWRFVEWNEKSFAELAGYAQAVPERLADVRLRPLATIPSCERPDAAYRVNGSCQLVPEGKAAERIDRKWMPVRDMEGLIEALDARVDTGRCVGEFSQAIRMKAGDLLPGDEVWSWTKGGWEPFSSRGDFPLPRDRFGDLLPVFARAWSGKELPIVPDDACDLLEYGQRSWLADDTWFGTWGPRTGRRLSADAAWTCSQGEDGIWEPAIPLKIICTEQKSLSRRLARLRKRQDLRLVARTSIGVAGMVGSFFAVAAAGGDLLGNATAGFLAAVSIFCLVGGMAVIVSGAAR